MTWLYNGHYGFGFVDIKREGGKLGPATYLEFNGEWPKPSFYTEAELQQLKNEGWEPSEAPSNT